MLIPQFIYEQRYLESDKGKQCLYRHVFLERNFNRLKRKFNTYLHFYLSYLKESLDHWLRNELIQPTFTYSYLTIETLEQSVKYVQI